MLVVYAPSRTPGTNTPDDAVIAIWRQPSRRRSSGRNGGNRAHRAEHVHGEDPGPVVVGEALDAPELLHADVRAQEVAPAEPLVDSPRRGREIDSASPVSTATASRVDAEGRELRAARCARRLVDVEQRDVHAGDGVLVGHCRAEAGPATRDDGHASGEILGAHSGQTTHVDGVAGWDVGAAWWQREYTHGADVEYEEQIIPLVVEHLRGTRRVLDVGCGEGQVARQLAAAGVDVIGLDPSGRRSRVRTNAAAGRGSCARAPSSSLSR